MTTKPTSIGARLAIGYAAFLLLILALSALAIMRVGQIGNLLDGAEGVARAKQRHATEMRGSVRERATALRDVVLAPDAAAAAGPIGRIKNLSDNYARAASPLDALFHELPVQPDEKKALAAIKEQERRTRPLLDRVVALHAEGRAQEATTLLTQQAGPAFADWMASLTRFIELEDKLASDGMGAARGLASSFPGWMAALCMAAVAATGPCAWFVARAVAPAAPAPEEAAAPSPVAPPPAPRRADEIVGAIDGIAFQANILALDAAVEAVRSGAHEGDAAEEARALAQRAEMVAQDIRQLLASPAAQQEEAASLGAIADAAARVTAVMSAIVPGAEFLETARRETAMLRAASAATALEQGARRLARALDVPAASVSG